MNKDEVLTLAGEPVGSIHTGHTTVNDERPWCREILLYSPGSNCDSPEYRTDIYTSDAIFMACEGLEEEIERMAARHLEALGRASEARIKLRQQLAAFQEVTDVDAAEALDNMDDYARMSNIDAIGPRQVLENYIKQTVCLKQQLANKEVENRDACLGLNDYYSQQLDEANERSFLASEAHVVTMQQLIAAQAENVRLREALDKIQDRNMTHLRSPVVTEIYQQNISHPSDTSALEALIAKAGEVMQGRCADEFPSGREHHIRVAIRAIPGVTLEDLK